MYDAKDAMKSNDARMCVWFFVFVLGVVATVPLQFLSVEHLRLEKRYGKTRGIRIGEILGLISGWGFFLFWFGIWLSPQPRFIVPVFQSIVLPITNFSVPIVHVIIFLPLFLMGVWFGIGGVKETTLKVAEKHRTERIVTKGVYSVVRHPQYLGGLLAHTSISFLLSGFYSLLSIPLMIILVYLIANKEEEELIGEFGREYEEYKTKVPMLIPRLARHA